MEHKEVGELQNELNREDGSGKTKGFHYTKRSSIEEIGETLKGVIGDNSEQQFGKEVNPKLFYAYGVDGAIQIAKIFNLSEAIVSITIVAIGTSLPEIITSLVASINKKSDLALGNVIGSNIFNICLLPGIGRNYKSN